MTRRLLAAGLLALFCSPGVASAFQYSVRNPVDGCTYKVWGPDITMHGCPPFCGVTVTGGTGQSVSCP